MDKYQEFSLSIAKDVIKVFERHNIQYYICSGTLLGAVRHRGFIPWDDDIDIMLPIKEYKKGLKLLRKELSSEKYFVQNFKSEKKFNLLWTHISSENTTFMPLNAKNHDVHFGMYIDIFPVIGLCDNLSFRKLQLKLLELQRTFASVEYAKAVGLEIIGKYKYVCAIPLLLRRFVVNLLNVFTLRDVGNRKLCTAVDSGFSTVWYPSYVFKERQKFQFEDQCFYGSKYYDEYLSIVYGDYMKLPPEDERVGHEGKQGEIIKDLRKNYTYYKNKH